MSSWFKVRKESEENVERLYVLEMIVDDVVLKKETS